MLASSNQRETVAAVRQRLRTCEAGSRPAILGGLDCLFPQGFQRGSLVEYLADSGSGAVALSLFAAREACRDGRSLVVIDRDRRFYPPGAVSFGINSNTVFVHPRTRKDELWALNQSLRCRGVGAVVCWPGKLDGRAFRGLQLAAESGGTVGMFIRPVGVRGDPTWSEVQLLVGALPSAKAIRRMRIEVLRCRNSKPRAPVEMELDYETGTLQPRVVPLAASMAVAANASSSPGA